MRSMLIICKIKKILSDFFHMLDFVYEIYIEIFVPLSEEKKNIKKR